jgi:hypothetical protein
VDTTGTVTSRAAVELRAPLPYLVAGQSTSRLRDDRESGSEHFLHLHWRNPVMGNNQVSRVEALLLPQHSRGNNGNGFVGVHMHALEGVIFPLPADDFLSAVGGTRGLNLSEDVRFRAAFVHVVTDSLTCHGALDGESFEQVYLYRYVC